MSDHVETQQMLEAVAGFVRRFVVLSNDAQGTAITLWVAHTWAVDAADATPYLAVLAPEKACGKSRVLEVVGALCARPWHVVGPSEAVLFRKLERDKPTVLIDEIDALFGSASERTEPLRAMINAGNRRGVAVPRCVGPSLELKDFSVFGAKALAGIDTGSLPDTIRDRSIPITMRRRRPDEIVERWILRDVEPEAAEIAGWLEDWAARFTEQLSNARPPLPDDVADRAAEAWEPLLAIADLAGGDWQSRARAAARELDGGADDSESRGVSLLRDIRTAFDVAGTEALFTTDLLDALNGAEELPWGGWHQGSGLRARDLAKLLRPYRIGSKKVRIGGSTLQGYSREAFEDAFTRYLPDVPEHDEIPEHAIPLVERDVPDVPDVPELTGKTGGVA